jgi:hypothetical protein
MSASLGSLSQKITAEIYIYTSPGVYVDVTSEYHEDPIISINGIQVQIYPDYSNGVVYDGSGNAIGFISIQ